ncbi:TPA: hypothetical protein I7181_18165 [Vibrio vulnificus]|nr:hypothetical protein [Vibrio vulnificus]
MSDYTERLDEAISSIEESAQKHRDLVYGDEQTDVDLGGEKVPSLRKSINQHVAGLVGLRGMKKVTDKMGLRCGPIWYVIDGEGSAKIITDLTRFYPKGWQADRCPFGLKIYYVDSVNGSVSGDGLSWSTAMKSINTAIHQPDVDAVLIAGGQHYGLDSDGVIAMGEYNGDRDVALISVGAPAIVSSARAVGWSVYDGDVYRSTSTGGSIPKVIDLSQVDEFGDPLEMRKASSIEDLTENAFYDDGNNVFIHLLGGRVPDENVLCLRSFINQVSAKGVKWYARNIKWYSAASGALRYQGCGEQTVATVEDCVFGYSSLDGLCVRDIGLSIARRCRSFKNANDAFNYHAYNGLDPHGIEEHCIAYGSQKRGTGNGSTLHENCRALRVNCHYAYNRGPGIADIQTSKSFNVAVTSKSNFNSSNSWGFLATEQCEMWIDGGSAYENSGNGEGGDVAFVSDVKAHVNGLATGSDIFLSGNATLDNDFS